MGEEVGSHTHTQLMYPCEAESHMCGPGGESR